jgi:hypothetical protein
VQRQEPRRGEERQRDEVDAAVATAASGDPGGVRERRVEGGGDQYEPEVRGLVLPVHVCRGPGEEDRQSGQRRREQAGDEDQLRADHCLDACAR